VGGGAIQLQIANRHRTEGGARGKFRQQVSAMSRSRPTSFNWQECAENLHRQIRQRGN